MNEHDHHDHEHPHLPSQSNATAGVPETQDAGTQALAEALRSSFFIVKIVMALMVVAFFSSGFFTVGPQEKAVILRFGKPVGEGEKILLNAGLHWSFPYPVDEVVKIPITEQQTLQSTVGWYFTTPEQELSGEEIPAGQSLDPARDGFAITADRNIIHTKATLHYHIEDPIRYVFGFLSASNTIQNALNESVLYTAAHFKVDDALYADQAGFQDAVRIRVGNLTDAEKLGIVIDNCNVQNIPPRQLKDVFAQVIESRENRTKTMTEARSAADKILRNADAQSKSIENLAESARTNYVSLVNADAKRFSELLPQYRTNSALVAQQMLMPALGNVMTNVQDKIFLPQRADGKPRELRLMLNREPPQPKNAASQ
ncbi:MAG TPA: protease modulator HflK [Methylomirabilota bacterium]|nr:protease modulator HflK [Methylomirabilota bacterium]